MGESGVSRKESGDDGMFMGEYQHNIDDKNRLIIPVKFRDMLGSSFVVTRGLDRCLFVYPMEEWKALTEKLKSLPFTKADARAFTRFFFSGATECEWDKQGRVNIPPHLREHGHLVKECVIIGVQSRMEIWGKTEWDAYSLEQEHSFGEIAEKLVDFNL